MRIESLIRPHLRAFQPYRSARSEVRDAKILLDANELPLGSPVAFDGVQINRYPDPVQEDLRTALAARLNLPASMVFAGAGSDEIIDLLIRLLCEPATGEVVVPGPTYGVYGVAAQVNNVRVREVEMDDAFDLDSEAISAALSPETGIVFCCSPNNPTGNLLSRTRILSLCGSFRGIVVVDEAYVEFAGAGASLAEQISETENLVVLRTLSKAWGLAGIRLGYCAAHPVLVSYLLRIKAPYNINSVSASLARSALTNTAFLAGAVEATVRERERVSALIAASKGVLRVYPSQANFLLVKFRDVQRVYDALRSRGIIVRRRREARLRDCLRISIGTPAENDSLVGILAECG